MAASPGARLLGRLTRSSLPPPCKVCGAPRWRQGPTRAPGSGNSKPWASWRSLWNPSRQVRRMVPEPSFTDFPFTGATWAPFHLLGKLREVRSGIVKLPHPTGGETEVQNTEQNGRLPYFFEDPAEEPGPGLMQEPREIRHDPTPSRGPALMKSWNVQLKGTGEPPGPSGLQVQTCTSQPQWGTAGAIPRGLGNHGS